MKYLLCLCLLIVGCTPVAQAVPGRVTLTPVPFPTPAPTSLPRTPNPAYPAPEMFAAMAAPPTFTATWTRDQKSLQVVWSAPGFHCLWLDTQPLDCRDDSADLLLRTGGVDSAYAPHPGQVLRLIDAVGNETARAVVPARLYRVVLNWIRR